MSSTRPREIPRKPGRATTKAHARHSPAKAPVVQVHAHRGGAALAPENTMAAFEQAADLGVHFFELDIRLCRTGELVVLHDADLNRVGGLDAAVADLPLSELSEVDVGSHFSPDFASARVPSLVQVLETFAGRVRFNIEVKEDAAGGDGTSDALGRLIHRMDLYGDVIVSSFNPFSLRRVRRHCRAPLGVVFPMDNGKGLAGKVRDRVMRRPWAAPLLSAYALHPREDLVTVERVRLAHLRGLAVNTWTVDDPVRMRELIAMRVNGLITDRPDLALEILAELDPQAK